MADIRPSRPSGTAARPRPLERLVAPPYDVVDAAGQVELLARSPHNVIRLTLPETEDAAVRAWSSWLEEGVLVRDGEPALWALEQDFVGPDGVARTRTGLVAALRLEPYERRIVLPHERTHRGPERKGGYGCSAPSAPSSSRSSCSTRESGPSRCPAPPALEVEGTRLWRIAADGVADAFRRQQLLIADGHHRYETALAFHEEDSSQASAWMLVVLVSAEDPGLAIFPTHRVFDGEALLSPNGSGGEPAAALEGCARPIQSARRWSR